MNSKRSTLIDWSHLSLLVIGVLFGVMVTAWYQKGAFKALATKHAILVVQVERLVANLDEHDDRLGSDDWVVDLRYSKDRIKSILPK